MKHTLITALGIIISVLTALLLVLTVYNTLDRLELNIQADKKLEALQERLDATNKELDEANQILLKFTQPIQYNSAAAPLYDILLSDELQQFTYTVCRYYGIEEHYELILAMMWQESNFDVNAVSATNDYGVMQINECNHKYLEDKLGIVDILEPHNNIESGVYIMSGLLKRYKDVNKALMAYNMGPGGAAAMWARANYTSNYSTAVVLKLEALKEK